MYSWGPVLIASPWEASQPLFLVIFEWLWLWDSGILCTLSEDTFCVRGGVQY